MWMLMGLTQGPMGTYGGIQRSVVKTWRRGRYDMIRINKADNGYVISARSAGRTPQSYGYTHQAVAKTVDEVLNVVHSYLTANAADGKGEHE